MTTTTSITHLVYRTEFHGGGLLSRHRSLAAAERAVARQRAGTDCVCGCAVVVEAGADVPEAGSGQSPYAAAS